MQKFPHFPIVFAVVAGTIALQTTLNPASARTSKKTAVDTPFCYMRTARQKIVDLNRLCNRATQPIKPQITVLEFQRLDDRIVGRVRNDTGVPVRYAIVNYSVATQLSPTNEVRGFVYVTPEALKPGQEGSFAGALEELGETRVVSVEWDSEKKQTASSLTRD